MDPVASGRRLLTAGGRAWNDQALPRLTDLVLAGEGVARLRAWTAQDLTGTVLEIGSGSGRSWKHFGPAVTQILAVEPSDTAWAQAEQLATELGLSVERVSTDAAHLPVPDDSVDHAVSMFALCTIPDVAGALAEIARTLRPGGSFRFLEHGRATSTGGHALQRLIEPVWKPVAGGCHLTRSPEELVRSAGLEIVHVRQLGTLAVSPWSYLRRGEARKLAP